MRQVGGVLVLAILATAIAGCTSKPATFSDIAPILARSCTHCHAEGGLAPFSLETYADASRYAGLIANAVETGEMPPWDAVHDDDCATPLPFAHDESLSAHDRDAIISWATNGTPEGTPGVRAIAHEPPTLDTWDITAAMSAPHVPPAGQDEYRCFVVDPGITTDRYVTAVDFVPGNPAIVHHASLLADPTRSLESKIGPDGLDCTTEITSAPLRELDPWTPGVGPDIYPAGVSRLLPANSLLVLQIHYAAHPDVGSASDQSAFHLQTVAAPTANLLMDWMFGGVTAPADAPPRLLPGPDDRGMVEFYIPEGVTDHTETMEIPVVPATAGRLFAIQAHAHFAATEIRAELQKADGTRICLLKDRWRFHWQRRYTYDAPADQLIQLDPGDVVTVRCTYNNSPTNQELVEFRDSLGLGLSDLTYGPYSTNEMCHVMLHVMTPSQ